MSKHESSSRDDLSRRNFLSGIIGVVAGAVAAIVGLPAVGFLVSPGVKKQNPEKWITLAPISGLTIGVPTGFPYSRKIADGWMESTQTGVAYAVTMDGQNVQVFSNVCTHLSCRVSWDETKQVFWCPCHDGAFAIDGRVVGGPPPRPLRQFQTKIEGGQIQILLEA